jgi:hypothetical protein
LRHWIGDLHEHDWHSVGALLDRRQGVRGISEDYVRHQSDQLRRIAPGETGITSDPADFDPNIPAFDPSQFA